MNHQLVSAHVEQGIVGDYMSGMKIRDIEHKYTVTRATVYWVIEKHHAAPHRTKKASRLTGDSIALAHLYRTIEAQETYIAQLEELLAAHGIDGPASAGA
jgi:hypothetical protein